LSPNVNEKALIQRCLKHDRVAQRELFLAYKDAMFTVLYRLLGNKEEAEEALQDGFVRTFSKLSSFQQKSTLGAWMKTIFIREALQRLRKTNKILSDDYQIENVETISFDDSLTGEVLERAILSLEDGFRTVFLLIEVEGYKHKEVADKLDINEGTSKSQLSRAKQKLKGILKEQGY
jgi:RNA polymerase sigma factor (sigma-70 family)